MRKWTYLVATLLMAGTTATFTGCIDTDEPEGIAELRGAKSEFIKAQAAVELVEVEFKKAQVAEQELVNAGLALQNKSAEIDLQLHELDIQVKKLLIEREEALTAQKKAEAEAALAEAEVNKTKWENEKALVVEQYKAKMILAETATANAQEAYKQAMEQIEASKILLTDEEDRRLNVVEANVAYAKRTMDLVMYGYSTTEISTETRTVSSSTTTEETGATTTTDQKIKYYVISQKPENVNVGYQKGSLKKLQEQLADYPNWVSDGNIEAKLDEALVDAEFALEAAQKAADKLKAILDNDYKTVADWEAESKKLGDEIAALAVQDEQFKIDRKKLEVANPKVIDAKNTAKTALTTAKTAQTDNKDKAKTSAAYTVKADKSIVAGLNAAVSSVAGLSGYNAGTFTYAKGILITDAQKSINGWNKLIDAATKGINLEELEWSKLKVDQAKADQKTAEDTYTADLKAWKDALAAYNKVANIDVAASKEAASKAIATFNGKKDARKDAANIAALTTALTTYYKNALDKDGQVTTKTESVNGKDIAVSTLILADAENLYKVVLESNVTWTKGDITAFTEITSSQINELLTLKSVAGSSKEDKWIAASGKVFGHEFDANNESARLLEVTEAEVIAAVGGDESDADLNTDKYGTLGNKIYATAETKRLVAVVEQAATYKALKDAFTAQYAAEQTAQEKANTALANDVTKAQDAYDKALAAYNKVFKELDDKTAEATQESTDKTAIKDVIDAQITAYLADNFSGTSGTTLEAIKTAVQAEYQKKLETVTTEKSNVAVAKRNIEKLAEGTYLDKQFMEDTFANIQENIKVKEAAYNAAKADYDAASAKLKALLAIFLK